MLGMEGRGKQLHLENILKGEIVNLKDWNMVVEGKISVMKNNRMSGYEFLKKLVLSTRGNMLSHNSKKECWD